MPYLVPERKYLLCAALATVLLAARAAAQDVIGEFPILQVPAANPLTPEKVRLGQALFYEEQLSSDDTMACATCHRLEAGGGDPRPAGRAPGQDGRLQTSDDEFGSFGVVLRDAKGEPKPHPLFGLERQVTARNPQTVLAAAFFNLQFADTRAMPTFRDEAGAVVLDEFASLESQAVGPILSSAEMGHEGRTWKDVTEKLAAVSPLALASDVPTALAAFVEGSASYGPLFGKAFGSEEITRERIAMAIASYERTLIPDQSPFDLGALTERQELGLKVYKRHGACELCHPSANRLFADGARRNIELVNHERAVKTPTLRNVGLRTRFMSSGQFTTLDQVVRHYENLEFVHFEDAAERVALLDFVGNALTDPRIAKGEAPFERPRLRSEAETTTPTAPAKPASTAPPREGSALAPERDGTHTGGR